MASVTSSVKDAVRQARRVWRYRQFYSGPTRSADQRPFAVVVGNCQAEPIARELAVNEDLAQAYRVVLVPAIHLLTPADARRLRAILPKVGLYVTQQVRDGYHGMQIGTEELVKELHPSAEVRRIPVLYYEGLYPYQVYVRDKRETSELAPLTGYHDLRYLYAAASGWDASNSQAWLDEFEPPAGAIQETAAGSKQSLRDREKSLDITMSDLLGLESGPSPSFFTVNHPSNAVLQHTANRVLESLDVIAAGDVSSPEWLDQEVTPIENVTLAELGVRDFGAQDHWVINGNEYSHQQMLAKHLDWYLANPSIVMAGLKQHAEKMHLLGLAR